MRTLLAVAVTYGLTWLLTFPMRLNGRMLTFLARNWEARQDRQGDILWPFSASVASVLPGLATGLVAGWVAIWVVKRYIDRVDLMMTIVWSGVIQIAQLLMFRLLFPAPADYLQVVGATAVLLGYVAGGLRSSLLSQRPRRALRLAWGVLVAVLMVETAVIPYLAFEAMP